MNPFPPEALPSGVPRDPLIGSLLQGRYRVLQRIGKGGMGVVYLAEHVLIRRKVAIKTLHANPPAAPAIVERFHREALAATAIGDQHVVDVTDMGLLDDGAYYIVMEYLDGADLAFTVAAEGRLAIPRAVRIVLQLCDALTAVHAAGIVHRDLKPENLFLIDRAGQRDFVKVLDFGVCKLTELHDGSYHKLTGTGAALGTPHFMAPEQIEGRPDVDHRADLYAVGGILHHALAGEAPFDAPSLPRLFMRICNDPPPPLRQLRGDVPAALEAVVLRALAKEPEDRFESAAELKAALEPFAELPEVSPARPTEPRSRQPPRAQQQAAAQAAPHARHVTDLEWVTLHGRRRWPLRAVLAGIALAILALGASLWNDPHEPLPPAAEAEPERTAPRMPAGPAPPPGPPAPVQASTRAQTAVPAAEPEAEPPARARSTRKPASAARASAEPTPPAEAAPTPATQPAPPAAEQPPAASNPLLPPRDLKRVF